MFDCRFLLYMIDDGDWHSLEEVAKEIGWPKKRVVECCKRLAEARFVHFDEDKGEVRVQKWLLGYARGVWEKPGKRSSGSVVLSPESAVSLQETEIQNMLPLPIEITFYIVDGKLKEMVIERFEESKVEKEKPKNLSASSKEEYRIPLQP